MYIEGGKDSKTENKKINFNRTTLLLTDKLGIKNEMKKDAKRK